MSDSLDKYADIYNLFDIDVISTLGLTQEDVEALENIDGIENSYGIKTKDTVAKIGEKESICKVIEYNENCNTPAIINGRFPENIDECLLDINYSMVDIESYIGKTILLENDDVDSNNNPIFTKKELTIVGIAESPLYISNERGNTNIGNGKIDFFIYVDSRIFNLDYYTNVYSKVVGTKELNLYSDEYWELVNKVVTKVENIKEERQIARYNSLINEATNKLNDAKTQFNEKKDEINKELESAENKIKDAKEQISKSDKELNASQKEIIIQEEKSKNEFVEARKKISDGNNQIIIKKKELENAKIELEDKKKEAEELLKNLNIGINELNNNLSKLLEQKEKLQQNGMDTTGIDILIEQANKSLESLNNQKNKIEKNLQDAENMITNGQVEITKKEKELKIQGNLLDATIKDTMNKISDGKKKIETAKKDLETAKLQIKEKEIEFEDKKQEALTKLNDAQTELDKKQDEINKIEKAKWYIQTRKDNIGYTNIIDAIKTITNISKLFPLIFYFVAILISLTSMTRMIEEERTEIGTLKALGYSNSKIILKYILYAFLACIIGGILGMSVGFFLLPNIIWIIYDSMYKIPKFYVTYRISIGLIGVLISFICIGGATTFVAIKELRNMPSTLMRPKAPKNGKKILLERISFIWKKFNFSKKVTARNIFRYKKRAMMTIVGIAGCTGLMLTGFGIKDSVMDIPKSQYEEIFTYDMSISLSDDKNLGQIEEILKKYESIENYSKICVSSSKIKGGDIKYETTIFVPETIQEFEKVCNLKDINTNEKITFTNNGVIVSDKVADMINIKNGDNIKVIDGENLEYSFKVENIVENYVSNYMYMTKDFYEENVKTYKTNMILLKAKTIVEEQRNELTKEILKIDGVASINMMSDMEKAINDILRSLNYVVIILIVASALLAFVVLYNLANINIGERKREIATLKVLGFFDKEVDNYINKENIIFTAIGIICGLVFGYFLTDVIIASVEIDKLRFIRNIMPMSYVYASVISTAFSLIVNYVVHFVLKKIDMIESLKSVE